MLGYEIKQEVSKQLGGYSIGWHGQSAAVVGSQIVLPAMDDDLDYPEVKYSQMLGYGLHELGHLRYTDHDLWDWAVQSHGRYLGGLINGLEDVRIERTMIRSGVDQTLFEAAINAALEDGYVDADDRNNICFVLAVEGRRLNGYRLACKSILDESPWASPIWWALKKMKDARSTGEVVTIALRLHRRLQ
jgi:hypothetical protein